MSLKTRTWSFLYNLDRALASLWGASPQSTISAEAARACQRGRWWGRFMCIGLNWLNPGHCDQAAHHARILESADDGVEK